MNQIVNFVMQNSAWIIGGAILVILAVIGYYADKTNFGQGKNAGTDKKDINQSLDLNQTGDAKTENSSLKLNVDDEKVDGKQIAAVKSLDAIELNLTDKEKKFAPQENIVEEDIKKESIQQEDFLDKVEERILENENQLNNTVEKKDKVNEVVENTLNNEINSVQQEEKKINSEPKSNNAVNEAIKKEVQKLKQVEIVKPTKQKKSKISAGEAAFNKFEKEFEALLPKKDLINADLLSDIDELELGKTQKIKLNEVPDLDDIDLPKIKNLMKDEKDIWKF